MGDNLDFIPQVPLFNLLEKFNGEKPFVTIAKGGESREIRRYSLRRIPPYVIFIIKRFRNNNFFVEKNPTIVTFPLKGLDLRDYIHPDGQPAAGRKARRHVWQVRDADTRGVARGGDGCRGRDRNGTRGSRRSGYHHRLRGPVRLWVLVTMCQTWSGRL